MSKTYLKIKIKSLAAEARIIRSEERKFCVQKRPKQSPASEGAHAPEEGAPDVVSQAAKTSAPAEGHNSNAASRRSGDNPIRNGLYRHRVDVVRAEARSAQLAYGFIRGRTYAQLERSCVEPPNTSRILKLIVRYGTLPESVPYREREAWAKAALKAWLEDGGPGLSKPEKVEKTAQAA